MTSPTPVSIRLGSNASSKAKIASSRACLLLAECVLSSDTRPLPRIIIIYTNPSIVQLRDGRLHIAHSYAARQYIKYVYISEEWVRGL